jgi:outer membrane lipoprotein SlyB
MKTLRVLFIAALSASVFIGGCASNDSGRMASQSNVNYGVVKSISTTNDNRSGLNAGTVIGGVIGAVAGNQVGGGNGNTLATVAGAGVGAVIGTNVENNSGTQMYNIGVRMQDGSFVTVNQKGSVADLRVGDRVRIENGQATRA